MDNSEENSGQTRSRGRLSTVVDQGVYVTRHALERLRLQHPNVGVRGACAFLSGAQEVEPGFIAPFLGRSLAGVGDRYFISASREGAFVIAPARGPGPSPWVLVTYLRFGDYQRGVAQRLLDAA